MPNIIHNPASTFQPNYMMFHHHQNEIDILRQQHINDIKLIESMQTLIRQKDEVINKIQNTVLTPDSGKLKAYCELLEKEINDQKIEIKNKLLYTSLFNISLS